MFHRNQLIGQWHRSDENEFERFSELAELNPDGSFVFHFYTYQLDGSLVSEIAEVGDWGLVGDIHFTITKEEVENQQRYMADLNNEDNYHAYKIIELTNDTFTYQHVVSGEQFTLYKVPTSAKHN